MAEEKKTTLEEAAKKHSCYDEDCEGAWYEPIVRNAFIAGAEWQKEQMLKDAVEGKVVELEGTPMTLTCSVQLKELNEALQPLGVKDGGKVKVIIIKSDD